MKAALHYLVLVGIPIVGVLGLLRLGSNLEPPISVGGEWYLALTNSTQVEASCAGLLDANVQPVLTVSQSGPHLVLELNTAEKIRFKGTLNESTITTAQNEPETVVFQVTIDHQSQPNTLAGAVTLPACKTPLTFTGFRHSHVAKAIEGH